MKIYPNPLVPDNLEKDPAGNTVTTRVTFMHIDADPAKPPEGETIMWESDGTGFGEDGDIIMASTVGGVTKRSIVFTYSSGSTW